ncbi:hypothetical protein PsAD13_04798 [Pseudovibrio sp. Ad13]|uniref:hypothetical protein n=1 Tax=unclassified Pseudovibrio TaxID=2627060 RepID=UPI0007AE3A5B|nr:MULTISPECIES: hypothetical protein [unclassified Pseudovibrio]KZK79810.1 hypothetical protein PsAD13_04798 [Pseudovibrio sp. Ad13]KZL01355.1 hypothetical protein PsAD5_00588 [Pseudovibrio sp. Ad5]
MKTYVSEFFNLVKNAEVEIYNEFSLQHELGIFLRQQLPDSVVQFERNISYFGFDKSAFFKKELDICVLSETRELLVAIELKFPRNGQYPEQMFSFCKDLVFLEQLKKAGVQSAYLVIVVDDPLFYSGLSNGIYSFFRSDRCLTGTVCKPTGSKDVLLNIEGEYQVKWQPIAKNIAFAIIEADIVDIAK